jgi:hypothetical protein
MARCRPKLVLALGTVRLARTCVRPLPARPVERPDDPTMLHCRIRSIKSCRHPYDHSESRSYSGPLAACGPLAGPAAGGAEMCIRRRHFLKADCPPLLSLSIKLVCVHTSTRSSRGPRVASGPGWATAQCRQTVQLRRGPSGNRRKFIMMVYTWYIPDI